MEKNSKKKVHDFVPYFACTANGDIEKECCLDQNRPDLCWIDNQPKRKEDCLYWELIEDESLYSGEN